MEHRIDKKSHNISFWKGNSACDCNADPDSCIVQVGGWNESFKLPEERAKMRNFGYMLDAAFAIGRDDAKTEIRKAIGL